MGHCGMVEFGFKLPDEIQAELKCHRVYIPDKAEYRQAFYSALLFFGKWVSWEKDYTTRASQAAKLWKEANNLTFDGWEDDCDCEDTPDYPDCPDCPDCGIDKSTDLENAQRALEAFVRAITESEDDCMGGIIHIEWRGSTLYATCNGIDYWPVPSAEGYTVPESGYSATLPGVGDTPADDTAGLQVEGYSALLNVLSGLAFGAADFDDFAFGALPFIISVFGTALPATALKNVYDAIMSYTDQPTFDATLQDSSELDKIAGSVACYFKELGESEPQITKTAIDAFKESLLAFDPWSSTLSDFLDLGPEAMSIFQKWAFKTSQASYEAATSYPCNPGVVAVTAPGIYPDAWRTVNFARQEPNIGGGYAEYWTKIVAAYHAKVVAIEMIAPAGFVPTSTYGGDSTYSQTFGHEPQTIMIGGFGTPIQPGDKIVSAIANTNPTLSWETICDLVSTDYDMRSQANSQAPIVLDVSAGDVYSTYFVGYGETSPVMNVAMQVRLHYYIDPNA